MYEYLATWRRKTKTILVKCLGGKCNKCGYDRCLAAIDFHHKFDKEFCISDLLKCPAKFDIIVNEAKKCTVLCKNCHSEFHAGLWGVDDITIVDFDECILLDLTTKKMPLCQQCGVNEVTSSRYKFCGDICRKQARTKNIPSRQELKSLMASFPMVHIARKFGVSDKAVAKWADKYELQKPQRGSWGRGQSVEFDDKV